MAYNPQNPNGQAVMADSSPVVIASDQSPVDVTPSLPPDAATETTLALVQGDTAAINSTTGGILNDIIGSTGIDYGTITANGEDVTLQLTQASLVGIQITGTWIGTLAFQATIDGTNWDTVFVEYPPTDSTPLFVDTTGTTSNAIFIARTGPYTKFRTIATAWTSGTATVTYHSSGLESSQSTNWLLSAIRGAAAQINGNIDVSLSSRASEATVAGLLTDTQLRATPVDVNGPLTDAELRASPVPVSLTSDIEIGAVEIKDGTSDTRVTVQSDGVDNAMVVMQNSQPLPTGAATETTVSGLLTDTQLRATPVPVSGTVATGGLTDAELRATPVPVSAAQSGTWNINNVSGTVSLPTGAATSTLQTQISGQLPTTLGQKTMANSMSTTIASDQTDIPTRATTTTTSSLTAGSLNADLVPSTDLSNYKGWSIQITGTWSGTLTFQGSNDNSTWVTAIAKNVATNSPVGVGTATANGVLYGNVQFKYLRIRMTAYTSGTANGTLILNTQAITPVVSGVTTQAVSVAQLPAALGQTTMSASTSVTMASDQSSIPVTLQATTTSGGILTASTTAYATNLVVKASAGALYSLTGYNSQNQVRFIQIHNTTSLPADTSVPIVMFAVPAQSSFAWSADGFGQAFSTGITVASSTTGPTLTVSGATMWVSATYK